MKRPLPEMVRNADIVGLVANAWRIDTKDHPTTIGGWIVNHPTAHPLWSQWLVSIVHLRATEGTKDAAKNYPEAEFELLVIAQDPDKPITDPDDFRLVPLHPIDVVKQFHGVSDDIAAHMLERLVEVVAGGGLSPDQDHRSLWIDAVDKMVEHFTVGHTPPDHLN